MLHGATTTSAPAASSRLGGEVPSLIRRLIVTAVLAGLGYSVLSTASRAYCPGGIGSDGGFVDHLGRSTDVVPMCIDLTLGPSPVVFLVLALLVVRAVTRAVGADHEAAARRTLDRAGAAVVVAAVVAAVVAQVAFSSIPLVGVWDGTGTPSLPGWLAVDIVVAPMSGT